MAENGQRVLVTVLDEESGETETRELLPDDYILTCGAGCYVSYQQFFPKSGTKQLTIKRDV